MHTKQIVVTGVALVLTVLLFEWLDIDLWLEDYFYNTGLKQWVLDRDMEIPKLVLYDGIKMIYGISLLILAAVMLIFRNNKIIKAYKQGLLIVLISCVLVPAVVGGLKDITNVPCPKSITHYNGHYPYIRFLDAYAQDFTESETQRCFPAGHASGGFALLSLFFLFKTRKNKFMALSFAMTTGWTTGLYKMLIGDHFLSHTIVTMLLAWLIILLVSGVIYSKKPYLVSPSRQAQI